MPRDMEGADDDEFFSQTDDHDADGPGEDEVEGTEGELEAALDPSGAPVEPPPITQDQGQRPDRKTRRHDRANGFAAQARASAEEAADLRRQLAEMAASVGRSADASARVADAVVRGQQPRAKTPVEIAQEKRLAAAARVNDEDPTSVRRFIQEETEINAEMQRAIAREEQERFRETLPKPRAPQVAALVAKAAWLDPDQPNGVAHANSVGIVVDRIANARGIDFRRATPQLREQIVNQAILEYGQLTGLPVNLPTRAAGNVAAVSGAGSRSFSPSAGGGGQRPVLSDFQRRLADQDPNFRHLPQAKRYPAYAQMVAREAKQAKG